MPLKGALYAKGLPEALHLVLGNQSDHGMWCNAEVVCGETSPQTKDAAHLDLLHGTINWALERHLSCDGIGLHLLDLRLHKVEWKAEGRGCEASNGTGTKHLHRARSPN